MELKGKIVRKLDLQTGQGKNGMWKKQEYILETEASQYPKKVCFHVWGEKIDQFGLAEGDEIVASIDIESREFNGRWYTNIQAWKVQKAGGQDEYNQEVPHENQVPDFIANNDDDTDDLPF